MNNQIPLFVHTAKELDQSLIQAVKKLHTQPKERKLYIQYNGRVIFKYCKYSDCNIFRRANKVGMKVLSLTNRSCTLLALSNKAYYQANIF